jgi:hypothetical protein
METFYLFLIIFLFVLAVFDLSVGVSNDAVNFMNSAIGSKAASFKVIMVIAAIGIFVGASPPCWTRPCNSLIPTTRQNVIKKFPSNRWKSELPVKGPSTNGSAGKEN